MQAVNELDQVAKGGSRWWVRVGCLGDVVLANAEFGRDKHSVTLKNRAVLLRTSRGVEVGQIIREASEPGPESDSMRPPSVKILRLTTANDDLLIGRLERHKADAVEACREAIELAGSDAVLLDVDHLFDGGTLLLHFLGDPPEDVDRVTSAAIAKYEGVVRTQDFSALLETGCGPGCGTEDSRGCGSSCQSCSLACNPRT